MCEFVCEFVFVGGVCCVCCVGVCVYTPSVFGGFLKCVSE